MESTFEASVAIPNRCPASLRRTQSDGDPTDTALDVAAFLDDGDSANAEIELESASPSERDSHTALSQDDSEPAVHGAKLRQPRGGFCVWSIQSVRRMSIVGATIVSLWWLLLVCFYAAQNWHERWLMLVTTSVPVCTLSVLCARLYQQYRAKLAEQADADARQLRAIHAALDFPDDTSGDNNAEDEDSGGNQLSDNPGNGLDLSPDELELERLDEDKPRLSAGFESMSEPEIDHSRCGFDVAVTALAAVLLLLLSALVIPAPTRLVSFASVSIVLCTWASVAVWFKHAVNEPRLLSAWLLNLALTVGALGMLAMPWFFVCTDVIWGNAGQQFTAPIQNVPWNCLDPQFSLDRSFPGMHIQHLDTGDYALVGSIPFPNASQPHRIAANSAIFDSLASNSATMPEFILIVAEFNLSASLVCSGRSALMTPFQTIYIVSRMVTPTATSRPDAQTASTIEPRDTFRRVLQTLVSSVRAFASGDGSSSNDRDCSRAPSFAEFGAAFRDPYILFATLCWLVPLGMLVAFSILAHLRARGRCACLSYHNLSRRPHSAA